MGESVTTWNPEDFGVPGSIATLIANPAFAEEHTTVVEDFLRATLHAYEYCGENAAECVESASSLSAAGYDVDHNTGIWETESELVGSSLPDGQDLGTVDFDLMKVQGDFLVEAGSIPSVPDLATIADNSFIEGVYADGSLVWPAP